MCPGPSLQQKQDPGSDPNRVLPSPLLMSGLSVGDCGDAPIGSTLMHGTGDGALPTDYYSTVASTYHTYLPIHSIHTTAT